MKYKIIQANDAQDFAKRLEPYVNTGWKLLGDLQVIVVKFASNERTKIIYIREITKVE